VPDEVQHEDAVLAQVVLDELDGDALVLIAVELVHQLEVLLDVPMSVDPYGDAEHPEEHRADGDRGDEYHPEPDEEEDLLVEEVDRQHALDGVALHVAEPTDLEVAHGDAGETRRHRPVVAGDHLFQNVDAVDVEALVEEGVEDEQLADDVDDVEQFDEQVERDEIVAAPTAAQEADGSGETVLEADRATGTNLPLADEISDQRIYDQQELFVNI